MNFKQFPKIVIEPKSDTPEPPISQNYNVYLDGKCISDVLERIDVSLVAGDLCRVTLCLIAYVETTVGGDV